MRNTAAVGICMCVVALWSSAGYGGTSAAKETVVRLHAALLGAAKQAEELGYEGRYALLEPVIKSTHDIPFICSLTLGRRTWKTMDATQQQAFAKTFLRLSVATYARRFRSYSGETFTILDETPQTDGSVVVRSRLTLADERELDFDYILKRSDATWLIINIIVDGVSDLALKRAEYTKTVKARGIDGLMASLESQIADLEVSD